jgi:hypothetical protein
MGHEEWCVNCEFSSASLLPLLSQPSSPTPYSLLLNKVELD